jgi:hypothetical protein
MWFSLEGQHQFMGKRPFPILIQLNVTFQLSLKWNYGDNANEYKENIYKARKMINELRPPWAPSTPPSLRSEVDGDPFLDLSSSQEL